jgi:hypothetical protein
MSVMKMLKKDEIDIKPDPDGEHIYVALFANHGYLHYEKFHLSDFPNDFISSSDLERFGIICGVDRMSL